MKRRCLNCGKEFETDPDHPREGFCSTECRHARKAWRNRRESGRTGETLAGDYLIEDYGEALRKARTQPRWCSDARWRIELSRRRNPAHFEALHPSPISPL